MWTLDNKTPYAAERNWVLDKNAEKSWIVVVKAAYDIHPDGAIELSEAQETLPPLYSPEYIGPPGRSSLKYEADLLGPKRFTDIVLNGRAYAGNGGRKKTKVDVILSIGQVRKHLIVFGDRFWRKGALGGVAISQPKPFDSMPLTYERAYGGWDTFPSDPAKHRMDLRNPVGAGFATEERHLIDQALPNVEYPKQLISSWKNKPHPAGFGPIASYWSPRKEFAGTYDENWQKERFPLWPEDYDIRFNQCAPLDQQMPGFLRGGQRVELTNLTPGEHMGFVLPKVFLFFVTHFGRDRLEHRADLHTVVIEPEIPRVIMVWFTSLKCHHRVDELDVTVISEKNYI